jgi:hypothetical protein
MENHELDFENVRVIGREKNKVKRKMKEAMHIARHKPKLNENEGWNIPEEWRNLLRFWDIPALRKEKPAWLC